MLMSKLVAANHGALPENVIEWCHGHTVMSYIFSLHEEMLWQQHQTAVYMKICDNIFVYSAVVNAVFAVLVIVWRLRGNIIRTAPCWVVWHNVHSQQHTHVSSSYRSSRLGLSHWDSYAMRRCGCLELHYCNMVEWSWWDSSLIWKTKWFPSVLWHCWLGHMTRKNRPRNDL